jgi:hypothetical protein
MMKMLAEGWPPATAGLVQEADAKGANAIIAFRFDSSELGSSGQRSVRGEQRSEHERSDGATPGPRLRWVAWA